MKTLRQFLRRKLDEFIEDSTSTQIQIWLTRYSRNLIDRWSIIPCFIVFRQRRGKAEWFLWGIERRHWWQTLPGSARTSVVCHAVGYGIGPIGTLFLSLDWLIDWAWYARSINETDAFQLRTVFLQTPSNKEYPNVKEEKRYEGTHQTRRRRSGWVNFISLI